jgi:hypothetical protein
VAVGKVDNENGSQLHVNDKMRMIGIRGWATSGIRKPDARRLRQRVGSPAR